MRYQTATKLPIVFMLATALILFIAAVAAPDVHAAATDFKPGRIIDDTTFVNKGSMTPGNIQTFLNAKVPVCDTSGTQPSEFGGGTRAQWAAARGYYPPFTCLKDYTENGKSAAQIIYDAAQEFSINPQVLIVLLQKEQGLVTDTWPMPYQYKTATGYGCPDTAACDSQYFGLTNQIRWSARMFQAIMNASPTWYTPYLTGNNQIPWNPNTKACGYSTVYIENRATQALYNYTPYRPNQAALNAGYGTGDSCSSYGNRNFYLYFSDWFGPTIGGTLVVKTSDSPAFYLVSGDTKNKIPSMEIYYAYGLDKYGVATVSSAYLNSLSNGNDLGNLVRDSLGSVQLVTNGKRYRLPSAASCTDWGLDCFNPYAVTTLSDPAINLITYGGDLQPLMASSGGIFKMQSGKRLPYLNEKAMNEDGYNFGTVTAVEDRLATAPLGPLIPNDQAVLKFPGSDAIYLYLDKNFYTFNDYSALNGWGLVGAVGPAPQSSYTNAPPTSQGNIYDLSIIDGVKYLASEGKAINLNGWSSYWPNAPDTSYLRNLLKTRPTPTVETKSAFRSDAGSIFTTDSTGFRPFLSSDDFYKLGYSEDKLIQVDNGAAARLPTGASQLYLGRVYKKTGSDGIYVANSGNTSLAIPSMEVFWSLRIDPAKIPTLSTSTTDAYPTSKTIGSFVALNGASGILAVNSTVYTVPDDLRDAWGLDPATSYVDISSINNGLQTKMMTKFAQSSTGAIYFAQNGKKAPITSYAKFISLGGNNFNVMRVSDDFLNALPTGSPL